MKWLWMIFLTLALGTAGCGKCKLSSECDQGEHCNFATGACESGCRSDSDCSPNTRCNLMIGACRAIDIPRDPNTNTSTVSDAGAVD